MILPRPSRMMDTGPSLEALVQEKGAAYLHQMLAEVDPKSAEAIHENNTKRVIRALEFYHQNHTPYFRTQ